MSRGLVETVNKFVKRVKGQRGASLYSRRGEPLETLQTATRGTRADRMSKDCRESLIKYHTTYYGTRSVSLASNVSSTAKSSNEPKRTRSDVGPDGSAGSRQRNQRPDVALYPFFCKLIQLCERSMGLAQQT